MAEMTQVYTPAGLCPVKLTGTDVETVNAWIEAVMESGHKQNKHYLPRALKYYVASFYGRGTEDWATVCVHINDWSGIASPPPRIIRAEPEKPIKKTNRTITKLPQQSLGSVARELQQGSDEIKIDE